MFHKANPEVSHPCTDLSITYAQMDFQKKYWVTKPFSCLENVTNSNASAGMFYITRKCLKKIFADFGCF